MPAPPSMLYAGAGPGLSRAPAPVTLPTTAATEPAQAGARGYFGPRAAFMRQIGITTALGILVVATGIAACQRRWGGGGSGRGHRRHQCSREPEPEVSQDQIDHAKE